MTTKETTIKDSHINSILDLVGVQAQMFESLYKQSEAVCAWCESVQHAAVDVLAGSCEHISLTQKKLCRGTAYLTVCWPGWASAHAHQQLTDWLTSGLTYWLRAEEPWEPKAPVRADCDSLSGRRKRRMLYSPWGGKKIYTHTLQITDMAYWHSTLRSFQEL